MNTISTDQNAETQLARLAAQRQLYIDAKRLYLGEVVAGVPVALGLAAVAIWVPQGRAVAAASCLLLLLLDVALIAPRQLQLRTHAARIQEAFDCDVLRLEWRELPCGRRPDAEFVIEHAERLRLRGGDGADLRDWYPRGVETLPLHLARIICQRTNCRWDGSQRRRYAWLGVGLVLIACGVLVLGARATALGTDGAAIVVVPMLLSLFFAVRRFAEHRAAARRADRLKVHAEALWSRALKEELTANETARESRSLQDAIFNHRCRSPSTIDRVYSWLRPAHEEQMNKAATAMIEEARQAMTAAAIISAARGTAASAEMRPESASKTEREAGSGRGQPEGVVAVPSDRPRVAPTSGSLTILCTATEWASGRGGLSTFNRELARACARAGHRVFCFVPSASESDIAYARAASVELVTARSTPGVTEEMRLLQRPSLPPGIVPDVIIGHGRVTGPAAKVLAEEHFAGARRVHVLHMAPGAIEWFKDRPASLPAERSATETAEVRERLEVDLAASAHLVVAVGPLLTREFGTLLHGRGVAVTEILPGLPEETQVEGPAPAYQCLVLGRAEDVSLKGLDIAARAVALVAERRPELRLQLVVRGAPPGEGDKLQRKLLEVAGAPGLGLRVRSYTSEADRIADDIRQSSVVLMPSRSEGFGLVGLEAISMGVPVLISERSGLAERIALDVRDSAPLSIVPVSCVLEHDAEEWARRIQFVLDDRSAAFRRAELLRQALRGRWSWADAVERLLAPPPSSASTAAAR